VNVVYANCLGTEPCDVLATDEPLVAEGADARVVICDAAFDPDEAQALNERVWRLGFDWARTDADPTEVDGVSSADLAGIESTLTVLLPAVRGVLEADALLAEVSPDQLVTAVAESEDPGFTRVESMLCAAVAATVRARTGVEAERRVVSDPGNAALVAKYAATRNPPSVASSNQRAERLTRLAAAIVNAAARLRGGRDGVMVVEYNPTAVVARRWHELAPPGAPVLVRSRFLPADVPAMLRHGERAFALPPARPGADAARVAEALAALDITALGVRFTVRGVDLAPIVVPELAAIALRHARWAEGRVAATRARLRRGPVRALLVPYDGAPAVRAVLRAAQAEGIPTAVLNDGWKGDDHQPEGMSADHAFALSTSVRDGYFRRRHDPADVVVTGDPRNDLSVPRTHRDGGDVLVGSFTFSPSDLNCRRGDSERFLDEVLAGIAASRLSGRRVIVKLHPADRTAHYAPVLARQAGLDVEVVATGDVLDMLPDAAVYITTYSTSLLSAALADTPFVYYRVNEQRLHAPFTADPVMDARTAATPAALTSLLDAPPGAVDPAWVEQYIGPRDGGNARRVIDALLALSLE
jgi:hypothetical protein